MKKILLPLLLLFSVNFAHAENIILDGPVVNLGYLESVNGLPFNQTLTLIRTMDTPDMVDVQFSYTQVEMICADRMPDAGGWSGGCGTNCGSTCTTCNNKSVEKHGYWGTDWHHDWHSHGHTDYNRNSYDRNPWGICRNWTTMDTQKSGKIRLVFKAPLHNDEDSTSGDELKLSITQRDLHTTVFWVHGWATNPKDYYKVTNLERTVIFDGI